MDDTEGVVGAETVQLVAHGPAARLSSWPKYSRTPSERQASIPELRPTTGMPAALASPIGPFMASGLASVSAMPSARSRIASRTSSA